MTLQVRFEIGDTDPESENAVALLAIQKLAPSPEHDRICGQLMILRGTQLLERAAAAEALGNYQDKITARRRATVARKAAKHANEA